MKCLILAAGYATRLYPLTENFPKPLLEVAGKPILDWLIEDLDKTGLISEYIVVSNHKFAPIFEAWSQGTMGTVPSVSSAANSCVPTVASGRAESRGTVPSLPPASVPITVLDDGTSSNETRLGAVRDILLGIEAKNITDDLLVMAGDNLLSFSLQPFLAYAQSKNTTCIMRYYEPDESRLHKCGVAEVDADGLILSMEEKPAHPKSHWCCPPFYFYKKEDLKLFKQGIAEGCGTDAPGSFIAWLSTKTPVHAYEMPGPRYDIGTLESYEAVKRTFNKI